MKGIDIIGFLGRNTELRDTPKGDSVCNFSVAVSTGKEDQKQTDWFSCALWGKRAETLTQYLTTGTRVFVSGRPTLRTFDKRDGTTGAEISIQVDSIELLGGGNREQPAARPAAAPAKPTNIDEDVPF